MDFQILGGRGTGGNSQDRRSRFAHPVYGQKQGPNQDALLAIQYGHSLRVLRKRRGAATVVKLATVRTMVRFTTRTMGVAPGTG